MTNSRKVFLVMLVVVLLGATAVFATEDTIIITQQNVVVGGNTVQNTVQDPIIQTGNTSVYNTTDTTQKLPQTGADDYAVLAVIAVFAVVAVYAYKKVSDYKNIARLSLAGGGVVIWVCVCVCVCVRAHSCIVLKNNQKF